MGPNPIPSAVEKHSPCASIFLMPSLGFGQSEPRLVARQIPSAKILEYSIQSLIALIMDTSKSSGELEDVRVNVKLKISALWIAVMFLYAYVDIFSWFKPGIIQEVMAGKVFVFQVSQSFLFFTTLYITIPSLMIFLTLVLKPKINRWVNIIVSALYFVTMLGACIGETWLFYIFGTVVESLLLFLIIIYAWKWPKYEKK
jgi:hypothetical protein